MRSAGVRLVLQAVVIIRLGTNLVKWQRLRMTFEQEEYSSSSPATAASSAISQLDRKIAIAFVLTLNLSDEAIVVSEAFPMTEKVV